MLAGIYEYSTSTSIAESERTNTSTSLIGERIRVCTRASTRTERVYAREFSVPFKNL